MTAPYSEKVFLDVLAEVGNMIDRDPKGSQSQELYEIFADV